nr:MAG TPA: hypothetical protein [Caudoviricetes sp.]
MKNSIDILLKSMQRYIIITQNQIPKNVILN